MLNPYDTYYELKYEAPLPLDKYACCLDRCVDAAVIEKAYGPVDTTASSFYALCEKHQDVVILSDVE